MKFTLPHDAAAIAMLAVATSFPDRPELLGALLHPDPDGGLDLVSTTSTVLIAQRITGCAKPGRAPGQMIINPLSPPEFHRRIQDAVDDVDPIPHGLDDTGGYFIDARELAACAALDALGESRPIDLVPQHEAASNGLLPFPTTWRSAVNRATKRTEHVSIYPLIFSAMARIDNMTTSFDYSQPEWKITMGGTHGAVVGRRKTSLPGIGGFTVAAMPIKPSASR